MPTLSTQTLQIGSTIVIIVGALTVILIRLRAAKHPTSAKKIMIPPLGMVTGFLMFLAPAMRIPVLYGVVAFLVGCLFAIPLITSSRMKEVDGDIYLKRSPAFIIVLLSLLVIRIALHTYIERYVTIAQTGAVFFILAFGMLLPWRIVMLIRYKQFAAQRAEAMRPSRGNA